MDWVRIFYIWWNCGKICGNIFEDQLSCHFHVSVIYKIISPVPFKLLTIYYPVSPHRLSSFSRFRSLYVYLLPSSIQDPFILFLQGFQDNFHSFLLRSFFFMVLPSSFLCSSFHCRYTVKNRFDFISLSLSLSTKSYWHRYLMVSSSYSVTLCSV